MTASFRPDPVLSGIVHIEPLRRADVRGWFCESYNERDFAAAGIDCRFVQDNQSLSKAPGTLRGLHFQKPPRAQDKLVRCARGSLLDVVVDLRAGSPTFGRHACVTLSAENGVQLFVPKGFAHGFCTLESDTEVAYKASDFYAPECDMGIAFDDSDIAIDWPFPVSDLILSERDRCHPRLAELPHVFPMNEVAAS